MAVKSAEKKPNYLVVGISFLFILIAVAITVFVKCPSEVVIYVLRVLLAIGATGILTLIGPTIKIENTFVKASGAIAFGVLIYVINPPKLFGVETCPDIQDYFAGNIFVGGKPVSEAQVDLIGGDQQGKKTNTIGAFAQFIISKKNRPDSLKLRIQYSRENSLQPIDTVLSFKTSEVLNRNIDILLIAKLRPQTFAGYVWDEQGRGISGVKVTAEGVTAVTDDGGYFKLESFSKESTLSVNFSKEHYHSSTLPLNFPNNNISVTLRRDHP
ncbi:MAG: hypothetical protein WBB36_16580 [Chitinophagales bacterium]